MKKLSVLLALILALAVVPAFAAEGDALLGRDGENSRYFNYGFCMDDTLYLVSGGYSMCTYRVGDADLTDHEIIMPEQEEENTSYEELLPFAAGGVMYAIDIKTIYDEDTTRFGGAALCRMTQQDDGRFAMEKLTDIDWSDMVEYSDEDAYPMRPDSLLGAGDKALMRVMDYNGDYQLRTIDLKTGAIELLDEVKDAYGIAAYRGDTVLVEQYNYDQNDKVRFFVYDPADESVQPLSELTVQPYSPPIGLAYDAETDKLYCIKGGEVCPIDLQAGEIGAGVTDMPIEVYNNASGLVMKGSYYCLCGDGAAIRNLDPGQRAETRLKICDSGWNESINNAYYRYSNAHGDVSLVLSRDWNESQNLLENMMNRDDSIDIYVLSTDNSIYDALYKRGYLMELDGSEKLAGFAGSMYPDIREALSSNGHLVALPVDITSWTIGFNEKALERLGMTLDDVPTNWWDFLDFIPTLEEPLKANNLHLFYSGYTSSDARHDLFNAVFSDYERYVNAVDPTMGYNTELLRGLLEKLEKIDFVALGCPEDEDSEDDESDMVTVSVDDYSEDSVLMQTSVGCVIGNFYSSYTPVLMGLNADTPIPLVLRTEVVFVNPFTKHPQEALGYMEEVADSLSTSVRYCVDPSLNEPIRGEQNEKNAEEARKWLEDARQQLAQADEVDKQMLEETIAQAEENLEYWEQFGWEVSQRELDWYRSHDDNIQLAGVDWLYADENGEAWDLVNQYQDHSIGLEEMLVGIDKKVQMMLLEGN